MLKYRNALAAGALLGATAMVTPALAADPIYWDQPSPTFSWSGFYVGVHAGAAGSQINWTYVGLGTTAHHTGTGALGGVQLGYNMQHGPWVFGAEGDLAFARINGSTACPNPGWSCHSRIDWLGSARLRAGFAFDQVLIYATGGFGMGGVRVHSVNPGGTVFGQRRTQTGWTAGGGGEFAFADGWSVKAEYLYYDLGRSAYTTSLPIRVHTRVHTGKIGVNFRW